MNIATPLRILLADDEKAVQSLYSSQLPLHLGNGAPSRIAELESELFDEPTDVDDAMPASVTVCGQGGDAVDLTSRAIESGTPFDVVVLDVRMPPGIDGVEAAVRIRSVDTKVPIIFLSGYSDFSKQEIDRRVPPPNRVFFISKPIRMAQLAAEIRNVTSD